MCIRFASNLQGIIIWDKIWLKILILSKFVADRRFYLVYIVNITPFPSSGFHSPPAASINHCATSSGWLRNGQWLEFKVFSISNDFGAIVCAFSTSFLWRSTWNKLSFSVNRYADGIYLHGAHETFSCITQDDCLLMATMCFSATSAGISLYNTSCGLTTSTLLFWIFC